MVLAHLLRQSHPGLAFSLIEVGARPVGDQELFYVLLELFPASRLLAFEPDTELCATMQQQARTRSVRYIDRALGVRRERRKLHLTRHPMCSSLYEPDQRYVETFGFLDMMALDRVIEIETVDLDSVLIETQSAPVDFIKIDVQGAELDVFRGATQAMRSALLIITEVEFAPLYKDQPLFGDVDHYLRSHGILFHKFAGLSGRMIKPMALEGQPDFAIQHLWTDAAFVRDYFRLDVLSDEQLLKYAVLVDLYGSPDLAASVLSEHDRRGGGQLAPTYVQSLVEQSRAAAPATAPNLGY